MKKIYYLIAASSLMAACNPVEEDGTFVPTIVDEAKMSEGISFKQFDADAQGELVESATGNYIQYSIPNVPAVVVYYVKPDGSQAILDSGKSGGVAYFMPKRGSDPTQTVFFSYTDINGKETVISRDFTVNVAADLTPGQKLLCGNAGRKTWVWDTSVEQCWGNAGYSGFATGGQGSITGGSWWGVNPEGIDEQIAGYGYGFKDSGTASMVLTDDGEIIKSSGGKGTFSVDLNEQNDLGGYGEGKTMGRLTTTGDGILFNQRINAADHPDKDAQIHEFDIAYITPEHLVLIAPNYYKSKGGESWQEGTFWRFVSTDDVEGCLTGNDKKTWRWSTASDQCWGNGGYNGFVYGGAASISGGQWWGVGPDGIADQIKGYAYPETADDGDATMTFYADGAFEKSSGAKGTWEYSTSETDDLGGFKEAKTRGRFKTSGTGILFNQRINAGDHADLPAQINEFDIVYLGDKNFVLIAPSYFKDKGGENWQEGTFWRFEAVE